MNVDRTSLAQWVVRYLANLLGIDELDVNLRKGIGDYGLDSADAVIMAASLEEHFAIEVEPSIFLEHDRLQEMIDALAAEPAVT